MLKTIALSLLLTTLLVLPNLAFAQEAKAPETDATKTETTKETEEKEPIPYQDKIKLLLPSQEALFDQNLKLDLNQDGIIDKNEQARLADGDLEQGLAPRIIQLLIRFSGIAIMILFTAAGVKLLLSRGNEEALTQTKELIVQVIIGSVLITASFGIILGIINLFNSL